MVMKYIVLQGVSGAVLVRAELAVSLWERMRGLLGRRELGAEEGLLIERCGAVHTVGMGFGIDVVFFDGGWRVCRVVRGVRPGRLCVSGGWGAKRVLELAEGSAVTERFAVGDVILPFQ